MIVRSRLATQLVLAVALVGCLAPPAAAFCGFYVSGADSKLYANATMVVLMRDGTKTVLSMQNNYDGPPEDFALVIPVPVILTQDMVKTLPREVFARVDALGAPRLVEYWERDPCNEAFLNGGAAAGSSAKGGAGGGKATGSVRVEASFAVGEYDIVILSADDSSSLASWLTDNHYNIPSDAESVLQPYVASGTKFFVAKVDPERVMFNDGQAALSPLRFHYDSEEFSLPIRLGVMNSKGQQDLIVNILAPDRYEVSNHPNVTIPTNIRVQDQVRDDFPGFYEALFARTLEKNPNAVVTEYAWTWNGCDPCPPAGMTITGPDLATLGADVTGVSSGGKGGAGGYGGAGGSGGSGGSGGASGSRASGPGVYPNTINYTLTRLHYRYSSADLKDDLVFSRANPLLGGRGIPDRTGELSMDVRESAGSNNFQGRYVILHPWDSPLTCKDPQRGFWGGPPSGGASMTQSAPNTTLSSGEPPKAGALPALLAQSLSALDVTADMPLDPLGSVKPGGGDGGTAQQPASASGCNCSIVSSQLARSSFTAWALAAGWFAAWRARSRRRPRRKH